MSYSQKRSFLKRVYLFFRNNVRYFPLRDLFVPEKLKLIRTVWPNTMVGYPRLSNVYDIALKLEKDRLPGAFVECGVWKGGCAGIMAKIAESFGSTRKLWLFDSFEGLPQPTEKDGFLGGQFQQIDLAGKLVSIGECVGPLEEVQKLFFEKLKISKDRVLFKKGWFQETLPGSRQEVGKIALLRIDADWYESTRCCLEHLYDQVVPGGFVLIDDYGQFEGCRKAVDEFLAKRGEKPVLKKIDHTGIYFCKERQTVLP